MRLRTAIFLFCGTFMAGFYCWMFVMMYLKGWTVIPEPCQKIALAEIILTAAIAVLGIERMINLREAIKKKGKEKKKGVL